MPRPIWNGQISFGLVTVPVSLHTAERRNDLSFHLIDQRNGARVRYQRVNEETGEEVPWEEIVKGYEHEDGSHVLLSDEDFERVAVEQTKSIDIEDFVDADAVDYVYFEQPYYLVPQKRAEKAYVLLREVLDRTNKIGIAKVVLRNRQHLAAVLPEGPALLLCILRFNDELRPLEDLELPAKSLDGHKVSKKELDMAEQLVASMAGEWEPDKYHDEYREALLAWIDEKAKTGRVEPPPAPRKERKGAEVVDLMSLLRRSISGEKRAPVRRAARVAKAAPKRKRKAATTKKKRATKRTKKARTGT
jgi:DNA end-binding protein Ku